MAQTEKKTEARHTRFWGSIEFLSERSAIVSLADESGEWTGGGRIELRNGNRADVYEAGYRVASLSAAARGGTLDRFSVIA